MQLKFKRLSDKAINPTRGSAKASGLDLYALGTYYINPGVTMIVRTGIAFEIPEGYEIQVRPRSGVSFRTNLRVANSPGTIDQDYKGDCSVIFTNIGDEQIQIESGTRIGQAVLCPVVIPELVEVTELSESERGDKGFGSTDKLSPSGAW